MGGVRRCYLTNMRLDILHIGGYLTYRKFEILHLKGYFTCRRSVLFVYLTYKRFKTFTSERLPYI